MAELALILAGCLAALVLLAFLLGFRLGGDHWQAELARVRAEAARAERRLHDLTREAFLQMAATIERQRRRAS